LNAAYHGEFASLSSVTKLVLATVRIAFVDDEAANRRIGDRLCRRLGIPPENIVMLTDGAVSSRVIACLVIDVRVGSRLTVFTAASEPGRDFAGIEASAYLATDPAIDVMLLDIRMPGKSGLEVLRDCEPKPRFPVIAMTGHVDAEALVEFQYALRVAHVLTLRTFVLRA
jgi:CheY-like chemotaxis protein